MFLTIHLRLDKAGVIDSLDAMDLSKQFNKGVTEGRWTFEDVVDRMLAERAWRP